MKDWLKVLLSIAVGVVFAILICIIFWHYIEEALLCLFVLAALSGLSMIAYSIMFGDD